MGTIKHRLTLFFYFLVICLFIFQDNCFVFANSFISSNTNVATTNTLLSNVTFQHNVNVTQLPTISKQNGTAISTINGLAGTTWVKQSASTTNDFYYLDSNATTYVGVGMNGLLAYSNNGTSWTIVNTGTTKTFDGIHWDGKEFLASGQSGLIIKSTDGITWTDMSLAGVTDSIQSVQYNGSLYVAVCSNGGIHTSSDGSTWVTQSSGTTNTLNNVAWAGSKWIVTGNSGTILTSSDGVTWVKQSTGLKGTLPTFTGIAYNGSLYVVVGANGTIMSSPDTVTWTKRTSPTTSTLWDVKYINNTFVAVGASGSIISSPDGITWSNNSISGGPILYGVAALNKQWAAVGASGAIYTSDPPAALFSSHTTNLTSGGITITKTSDSTKTFTVTFASANITSSTDVKTGVTSLVNAINSNSSNFGISATSTIDSVNYTITINLSSSAKGSTSDFTVSGDSKFITDSGLTNSSNHIVGANYQYTVDGGTVLSSISNTVTLNNSTTGSAQATINLVGVGTTIISNDATPPGEVTSLQETHTDTTVNLTYKNPTDSDFSYCKIYRDSSLIGNNITSGNFSDSGLNPSTTYTYKVTTVDTSGNESNGTSISVTTNSSGSLDITAPMTLVDFGTKAIDGTIQTLNSNVNTLNINDSRTTSDGWHITVEATPFVLTTNSSFSLPKGSLKLNGISSITKVSGSSNLPSVVGTYPVTIDDGAVTILSAAPGYGSGSYNISFVNNALTLTIDTSKKIIDNPLVQNSYSSTITWTAISGP